MEAADSSVTLLTPSVSQGVTFRKIIILIALKVPDLREAYY
jgi:hypothetical protein